MTHNNIPTSSQSYALLCAFCGATEHAGTVSKLEGKDLSVSFIISVLCYQCGIPFLSCSYVNIFVFIILNIIVIRCLLYISP